MLRRVAGHGEALIGELFFTDGSAIASFAMRLSAATMLSGVFAGAIMPYQFSIRISGMPTSAVVGTSGAACALRKRQRDRAQRCRLDILIENWYGMIAPAKRLITSWPRSTALRTRPMADPSVKEKLADQGLAVAGDTPEHFRGYINAETKKWQK